jgi:alanine dehydrogenase
MRGIFDAKKYYKPRKFFWPTFAGSTFVLFPGAIIGVSKVNKALKHMNDIPVPNVNPTYAQNEKYKLGYRVMVTTKNQRAVDRGVMLGTLLCVAILVPLSL